MKRLSILQKGKIRDLAKNSSLNKISTELSLPKSTVQYWYKGYSKYNPPQSITLNLKSDELIGEFIGLFAGDGNYTMDNNYKHQIRIYITGTDLGYIIHVKNLMVAVFGKTPWIHIDSKENVAQIRLISKSIIVFIQNYLVWEHTKTKTVRLRSKIKRSSAFTIGFLRGLMDSDGHLDRKNNRAIFSTVSPNLASDIERSLRALGIKFKTREYLDKRPNHLPVFRVVVSRDFKKFTSIIKPYHITNS